MNFLTPDVYMFIKVDEHKLYQNCFVCVYFTRPGIKYKEVINRPSSVNLESSVHIPKPRINITLKTKRTLGKSQVCEKVPGESKFHPPWNQEYNQSYPMRPNLVYVTHTNRGLGHTQTAKWEY